MEDLSRYERSNIRRLTSFIFVVAAAAVMNNIFGFMKFLGGER